jgi:acetolactate synthase-1/2/3 large subunit
LTTVAESVAQALFEAEVEHVFGLPGIHNIALWPPLAAAGVRVIGSRHEQGTVGAADGYARATGKIGVALTTTGPGAANTLGAVGEAWASRSPVLVLCSDIPSHGRREGVHRGFVHECVDQAGMFRPVTKETIVVDSPDDFAAAVTRAIELALTPPMRPVYVEFPTDFLGAEAMTQARAPRMDAPAAADPDELAMAAAVLAEASRPLIWVGGGGRDAGEEVEALAARLGAPILTTFQARGLVDPDHPLLVPLPSQEPSVVELIERADAVLIVGSDLDPTTTEEFRTPLPELRVAINIDPEDAVKNYRATTLVVADAAVAVASLTELVEECEPWAGNLASMRGRLLDQMALQPATAEAAEFLRVIDRVVPERAYVFADMAIPGYWLSAYSRVGRGRRLHFPMGWGTLGFAMPAALGAAVGVANPVVSFSGDGGILFALGELAVLAQERIPLTVVIFDDGGYGVLRHGHQQPPELSGTELLVPDFATIARGFGLAARSVTGVGESFEEALAEAIASGEPNVLVSATSLYPPPTASPMWPRKAAGIAPDTYLEAAPMPAGARS